MLSAYSNVFLTCFFFSYFCVQLRAKLAEAQRLQKATADALTAEKQKLQRLQQELVQVFIYIQQTTTFQGL